MAISELSWRLIAIAQPEFVQWAVQTHGPLPEMCTKPEYDRLVSEYKKAMSV
jgi:hypothetical protein